MTCCCANKCNVCPNLTVSTDVAVNTAGTALVITVPDMNVTSMQKICLLVAQSIPTGADALPVQMQSGDTIMSLATKCGILVRGDQIRSRRVYNLRAATSSLLLTVTGGTICPTSYVEPVLLPTV